MILVIGLLLLLCVGVLIAGDYGLSMDGWSDVKYAQRAIEAIKGERVNWEKPNVYKGPAFFLVWEAGANFISRLLPHVELQAARNFLIYSTFVSAIIAVYLIGEFLFSPKAGVFGASLFATQPLLFGHAFMNEKDVPFMAFFAVTIALGCRSVRAMQSYTPRSGMDRSERSLFTRSALQTLAEKWRLIDHPTRRIVIGSLIILGAGVLTLGIAIALSRVFVHLAYYQRGPDLLSDWFRATADNYDAIPVGNYQRKAALIIFRLGGRAILILGGALFLANSYLNRGVLTFTWTHYFRPSLGYWRRSGILFWLIPGVICAGITTAIRPLGIFSLIILLIIIGIEDSSRFFEVLLPAFVIWAGITYLLWPYLWMSPFEHFIESFSANTRYPWSGPVLFMGIQYWGGVVPESGLTTYVPGLPWYYIPYNMLLQFTEPVLILFIVGTAAGLISHGRPKKRMTTLVLLAWLLAPIVFVILSRAHVYDNFRHFLFVCPPIFVLAGAGLGGIVEALSRRLIRVVLVTAVLLPGIVNLIVLHPYQYVYYNQFTGGLRGAYGNFEIDYWCLSTTEAMEFVNQNTPQDGDLLVWGAASVAKLLAREDIRIKDIGSPRGAFETQATYLLACDRNLGDVNLFPEEEIVHSISIKEVPLAVIKQIR